MPSNLYFQDPAKTGRFISRKASIIARRNPTLILTYAVLALCVLCIVTYWFLFSASDVEIDSGSRFSTSVPQQKAAALPKEFADEPLARAAQEALYNEETADRRKLRSPPDSKPIFERKRLIVLGSEGGRINTGVWPGWGDSGSREVTLNWAAAGVRVQKYCPWACEITHDENQMGRADAVVMELVNHPKFGLDGQAVAWPRQDRPNPRAEDGGEIDGKPVPAQLPLLGLFYYEAAVSYPSYTLSSSDVKNKFDFTMTPDTSTSLPVTLVCPWGRPIESFLDPMPPKQPGRLLAYFSEHGTAPQYRKFVDELFSAAGEGIHAYIHRRNRDLPAEAGGDPYQLSRRIDFVSTYKFVFVTEAIEEKDFLTPEWSQIILAGAVPVYLGMQEIAQYAPGPRSFIDARLFATGADLWDYLKSFDGASDAAADAYSNFFTWKQGAAAAYAEDERGHRFAIGTRQGVVQTWPEGKQKVAIAREVSKWPRPVVSADQQQQVGDEQDFKETAKWAWRAFRETLDNCVHYAECRLCEYVHKFT